ncbi:jg18278 [Pararge aegeria aegeria]|uniref:Jg18278 protein n=1 Tax=Pararge aegeria aegeria TaxID=348720 RepID=A0A8S4SEE0_9NEOP|nr:jg18278 [Pararge aegeria aegeria]
MEPDACHHTSISTNCRKAEQEFTTSKSILYFTRLIPRVQGVGPLPPCASQHPKLPTACARGVPYHLTDKVLVTDKWRLNLFELTILNKWKRPVSGSIKASAATSSIVGAAASSAKLAKRRKYENLDSSFIFVPFGVETLVPWGPEATALFKELSKRVIESTGDPRAGSYLGQRISLAIQRGNTASILGTVPRCGGFEVVLDFI